MPTVLSPGVKHVRDVNERNIIEMYRRGTGKRYVLRAVGEESTGGMVV